MSAEQLLLACGRELGRSEALMQPIVDAIVNEAWCETVEALRELSGEQLSALTFIDAKGTAQRLPARLVARIQQKLNEDPEAIVSPSTPSKPADQKELVALMERVQRQDAVRRALHVAIAEGNVAETEDALSRGRDLLLDVEIEWATRELKALEAKEAKRKEMDEVRSVIAMALKDSEADVPYLEHAIKRARDVGLPDEEVAKVEDELDRRLALQERAKLAETTWQQAQDFIRRGQVLQLVELLKNGEGVLQPEQIALAQRKIPGMEARARLRKDLATTLRSAEPDVDTLLGLVFNAKRSNLPQEEIADAERALEEAQNRAKIKVMKENGGQKHRNVNEAWGEVDNSVADKEAGELAKKEESAMEAQSFLDRLSPLEREIMDAARSTDSRLLQAAIEKAKAAGLTRGQISRLHVQAIAAARG